jgi:peptidoglycan hydrolase CwlO-like protein
MSEMSSDYEYWTKFDFYLTTLTFGILGLSIKTSDMSNTLIVSITSELFGGLFLTWCGLICLERMTWTPLLLYHDKQYKRYTDKSDTVLKEVKCDTEEEYKELEKKVQNIHNKVEEHLKKCDSVSGMICTKFNNQIWLFFSGIVCLVISRFSVKTVQLYNLLFP